MTYKPRSSVDFIFSSVPPWVRDPIGVSTLVVAQGCGLWPPTESAKLILGKDLRFEAAKPLLETSTDRRSVTSTDDRGLYVTKGAVKPTHSHTETAPPKYIYMPLDIPCDPASINKWIQKTKTEMKPKYTLYATHYWYLDEFSCILVKRNRLWFQSVLPKIQNTWNLIEISRTNIDNV